MMPTNLIARSCTALMLALMLGACAASPPKEDLAEKGADVTLLAVDLHRDHGWAAMRAERYAEAGRFFKRILKERANDQDAIVGLGEALLGQNQLDQALSQFERIGAGADAALLSKVLQGQGIIHVRRGNHEQAEVLLNQAIELDPELWRAWNGLGRVRDGRKDYAAARYAYRKAIKISPRHALLHNNLGFSLLASGEPAYAESSIGRALELDPGLEIAAANLRLALALQGRYEPALAGVPAGERARVMNNVGYAALLRGDHQKARSLFLDALAADPAFFQEARRNLAYLESLDAN